MKNSAKHKNTGEINTYRKRRCPVFISLLCVLVFCAVFNHERLPTSPIVHSCFELGRSYDELCKTERHNIVVHFTV